MKKENSYIWLIGENNGKTANNNSFYFWEHISQNYKDDIKKYYVVEKNKRNKNMYNRLTKEQKKLIVWKNSLKHYKVFKESDMYFVSFSYKDVIPNNIIWKILRARLRKPVIYLQHGTLLMKKLGYKGNSYNNNMFRFVYYNESIKNILQKENDFRDYQLHYGVFHPRYKQLAKLYLQMPKKENKQILWFLTWREYLGDNLQTEQLVENIKSIINNAKLKNYLIQNSIKLKICTHQLFNKKIADSIKKAKLNNVEIIVNSKDIMQEIVNSDMLITDYSSISFDFTILSKPVILYQPDLEEYIKQREFYCNIDEMRKNSISDQNKLIEEIVEKKYEINKFIKNNCPKIIDLEEISKGTYIDKMYKEFKYIQENKITFLGYNFYGVGGTISATKALAEGLLEKGYLVELISLKRTCKPNNFPYALSDSYMYSTQTRNILLKIIQKIIQKLIPRKFMSYLKYDALNKFIKPYAPYKLTKILNEIKSNTVVSARESLHLFLYDAKSEKIKNKIYFFHCNANVMEKQFPTCMEQFKNKKLSKVVFVTEKSRQEIQSKFGYNNYDYSWISGNTLERRNCLDKSLIKDVKQKSIYKAIYLLRISKDRMDDIHNLIRYSKYMKEKNVNNLIIDVFGQGNYVKEFTEMIKKEGLEEIIHFMGSTKEAIKEIRQHDIMIDFSVNQSFGMTYLEGILNGKMVFCMKNTGSEEVMEGIDNAFIKSPEDLVEKIKNVHNIKAELLKENYDKIWKKYSREKIAQGFLDFINNN